MTLMFMVRDLRHLKASWHSYHQKVFLLPYHWACHETNTSFVSILLDVCCKVMIVLQRIVDLFTNNWKYRSFIHMMFVSVWPNTVLRQHCVYTGVKHLYDWLFVRDLFFMSHFMCTLFRNFYIQCILPSICFVP